MLQQRTALVRKTPLARSAPLQRAKPKASTALALPKELKPPRPRKCKVCGGPSTTRIGLLPFCCPEHGVELALLVRERQQRAEAKKAAAKEAANTRARRQALETLPELIARAQKVFNGFIRERDFGKACICCGRTSNGWTRGGDWDAGHYRSRGAAPELRFDERNVHAQLKQCNRRAFDVATYRANMIDRIGLAAVEDVEGPHPPRKYDAATLRALIVEYRAKTRELKKAREQACR